MSSKIALNIKQVSKKSFPIIKYHIKEYEYLSAPTEICDAASEAMTVLVLGVKKGNKMRTMIEKRGGENMKYQV